MNARDAAYTAHRAGHLNQAEAAYRDWLAAQPQDHAARHAFAVLLLQRQRPDDALTQLEFLQALPQPPSGTALLLATACRALGEVARGLAAIEPALTAHPRDADAWALAGSLRTMAGDAVGGEAALRRALQFAPRQPETERWLAIALHRQQRWAEAIETYRRVLAVAPDDASVRYNLALSLEHAGEWRAAVDELERVVAQRPQRLDARARLAGLQALLCDFECEARSVEVLEALLSEPAALAADDQLEPFALTFLPLEASCVRTALARYSGKVAREAATLPPVRRTRLPRSGPVRLGYLSADFGDHAVGGLVRDHFAAHDRALVSVHGYSLRRLAGATADTIRAGFDTFADLDDLATADAAQRIADDGIDVLIDLSGYTLGARPALLALRPAPVQLGWLGFIHDHAAPWLDGLVMDAWLVPPGSEMGFTNRILRVEGCALPAARRTPFAREPRAAFGLPEHVPLLASFNNSYKLDADLVAAWVAIARQVPEARFVIYVPDAARLGLADAWKRAGGDPAALLFVPKLDPVRHLARAAACDLFLDAFRYQAGATAVAAFEAGLPILCRRGQRPLSRLGASLLGAVGMEALVCADTKAYVDRAAGLAGAPERLLEVRENLAQAIDSSRFFDPARMSGQIEALIARLA